MFIIAYESETHMTFEQAVPVQIDSFEICSILQNFITGSKIIEGNLQYLEWELWFKDTKILCLFLPYFYD